jgi:hypothetical protein
MRQLNELFFSQLKEEERGLQSFIPELIDILCPEPTSKPIKSPNGKDSTLHNIKYKNEVYDLS